MCLSNVFIGYGIFHPIEMWSLFTVRMFRHTNRSSVKTLYSGGSVVEYRTPEREVGGSKPTAAVLCP